MKKPPARKSASAKKSKRRSVSPVAFSIRAFYVGFVTVIILGLFFAFWKLGNTTHVCANSISCVNDLSGTYDPQASTGTFLGKKIAIPQEITQASSKMNVLGDTTGFPKHIYVDLTKQELFAYEGNTQVYDFAISSGKWHPTPTGNFTIWVKLRYTRMSGGSGADYYNLPNVPYTMFFSGDNASKGDGFSLHGAYWHNNFGHPMSHGCVNMRIEDAHAIYDWANPVTTAPTTYATDADPGTQITIFGTAPAS